MTIELDRIGLGPQYSYLGNIVMLMYSRHGSDHILSNRLSIARVIETDIGADSQ